MSVKMRSTYSLKLCYAVHKSPFISKLPEVYVKYKGSEEKLIGDKKNYREVEYNALEDDNFCVNNAIYLEGRSFFIKASAEIFIK